MPTLLNKQPLDPTYYSDLTGPERLRYAEKVEICDRIDPFTLRPGTDTSSDVNVFPDICYGDIANYLVFSANYLTLEEMKAFKSTEAHNYFTSGWVKGLSAKQLQDDKVLLLGESNIWLPAYVEKVQFKRLKDIDFTSSRVKKRKLDDIINSSSSAETEVKTRMDIPAPTKQELADLYKAFESTNVVPAVFSVLPEYQHNFQEPVRTKPAHLRKLYCDENLADDLDVLLEKATNFMSTFSVTEDTVKSVEVATRRQSNSSDWFLYRSGRVTASVMKRVCHTSIQRPSLSLLKAVCYPEKNVVKVPALTWGLDHEKDAFEAYKAKEANKHHGFLCQRSGMHLSTAHPFIGASPDAIVSCSCCGKGVVEFKCPFLLKDAKEITTKNSCLSDAEGLFKLQSSHAYYYQIQTQMTVCKVEFCDFVVWGPNVLHIERVRRDEQFCINIFARARQFFERIILPELFSRFYTRQQSSLEDKPSDARTLEKRQRRPGCRGSSILLPRLRPYASPELPLSGIAVSPSDRAVRGHHVWSCSRAKASETSPGLPPPTVSMVCLQT
ncbi:hypothetical protein HPB50_018470 [Hyalomma asiaticum]|uniref:Uncharacterized protein n=1 Tax=Hyalomma asiaticum TaxID=266040 RepID=A0ACB7TMV7_HYAAI|nr:hypothetical protein HPB50_018470 [Hyalomma asiaticum]